MSHNNWMEKRKGKISASNAAAILGLKPFGKTPLDAWLEIKGLKTQKEESREMRQGRRVEAALADLYTDDTGSKLITVNEPLIHPDLSWLCGTPDRLVAGEQKGIEIKNVGKFMADGFGEPGTDQIPDYYLVQVSIYIAITKYNFDVWASIAGTYPEIYPIIRDIELENMILEKLDEWYKIYIIGNQEPEIDSSPSCAEYLAKKYPKNFAPLKEATPDEDHLLQKLSEVRDALKSYEEQEEEIKNLLKNSIGDADGIQGSDWKATWKATKESKKIDWERLARNLLKPLTLDDQQLVKDLYTIPVQGIRRFLFSQKKGE